MARGVSVFNNLVLNFNRIGDNVKTNFESNVHFLYDSETHYEILKDNEIYWEVVAPSKMLLNGLRGNEVVYFKKLYREAHSREQKQLRNYVKKFIFGEASVLEKTVKDSGKELNLSFDMLAWITTHPLTDEQKKISLELNSAAIPSIVKSLNRLSGVEKERDEFKEIAKEHAKALTWMEFSASKDQRKKKRLKKDVKKFQLLYEIEKEAVKKAKKRKSICSKSRKKSSKRRKKSSKSTKTSRRRSKTSS